MNVLLVILMFPLAIWYFSREARQEGALTQRWDVPAKDSPGFSGLISHERVKDPPVQRKRALFGDVREIAGLKALDEGIRQAVEKGRPVLFLPGNHDMDDLQTVAGMNILGEVARKTAPFEVPLLCPMARPFAMTVAQDVVRSAYQSKGFADHFHAEHIQFLTQDQFGYAAGVSGIMVRELPGACFFFGNFGAEALILAETGNSVGAFQVAGTADTQQIPFFLVACDHTLIGEELFAASALLSRHPVELGTLRAQDLAKMIVIFLILVGSLLVTLKQASLGNDGGMVTSLTERYFSLFTTK